jgi:VanZ family protein
MPGYLPRNLFLLLALLWASVIYYLSSQPGIDVPALFPGQDKLFHLMAFGLLGFLAMGVVKPVKKGFKIWQALLVIALVSLYGLLDETHQYFVPGRSAEVYDVIADVAGGLLGALTMYFLARVLSRRTPGLPK